jgi:hypothetical protein
MIAVPMRRAVTRSFRKTCCNTSSSTGRLKSYRFAKHLTRPLPESGRVAATWRDFSGHSAMATLKLFQQRREMWRDGMVDRIVPGPQPSPDFPQPRAAAQDVARFGSAQLTTPALALTNARGLRLARTCARPLSTKRPFLLRTSVKIYGISRHVVFTIFFGDRAFSGSSPNARARYMSASLRY